MKYLNQAKKFSTKIATGVTTLALTAPMAYAEVPEAVQTELDSAKAMGVAIGVAVLIVILAIAATKYARRSA